MSNPAESGDPQHPGRATAAVVRRALWVCAAAFGFCFAMIPLYRIYCEITGANGKTGRIAEASAGAVDLSRSVTIQFVSSVNSSLDWGFQPLHRSIVVHPGAVTEARFVARNNGLTTVVGKAVPSVAPNDASLYFNKTECFCFTEQQLNPGQSMELPVRFVVDPALPADIHMLTLSYTFFADEIATRKLALVAPSPDNRGS